ncbi:MAG: NusG domain II-containing protein [Candidatus Latescibacterota bacterium]
MKRYFTQGDIILIAVLLVLSLLSLGAIRFLGVSGKHAVVGVDNRRVLELPLDHDIVTTVTGPLGETVIKVGNGAVCIPESPCPDKYCVHMGHISHAGEILVCVPNHIIVRITGGKNDDKAFDGVVE